MIDSNIFKRFIIDCKISGKADSTINNYKRSINRLSNYIKANNLEQETLERNEAIIESYLFNGGENRNWSKYTLWSEYKNIKAYYQWLISRKIINQNPFNTIIKPKQPPSYPKALYMEDVQNILIALDSTKYYSVFTCIRNKALINMLLYTGIRKNELISLEFNDVDLESQFIFINKGKGQKSREIPIENNHLYPILKAYVIERGKYFDCKDRFFMNKWRASTGNKKLSEQAFNRIFKVLSKQLQKRIHAHKLRHTFATQILEETGDIYTLKELMGHSDIKTTTIYLSTSRTRKIEIINSLKLTWNT